MLSVIIPTLVANLATTGCALLLVRKGPTRRIKMLTLTAGLMSLTQTAALLQVQSQLTAGAAPVSQVHQVLAAMLSVMAIVLLTREIYDRAQLDRRLRIAEAQGPAGASSELPADQVQVHDSSVRATTDLLIMLNAVSAEEAMAHPAPAQPSHIEDCPLCQQIARDMAAAWLEVHLYLENKEVDPERLHKARMRVTRVLQTKRQHELRSGHELPLLASPKEEVNGTVHAHR